MAPVRRHLYVAVGCGEVRFACRKRLYTRWQRFCEVRFETGHHFGQSTSISTSRYQARARDQPEIASAYGSRPKTTVGADLPFSA